MAHEILTEICMFPLDLGFALVAALIVDGVRRRARR